MSNSVPIRPYSEYCDRVARLDVAMHRCGDVMFGCSMERPQRFHRRRSSSVASVRNFACQ
jgi:hypothetical protein